jgi:hypothetical protein
MTADMLFERAIDRHRHGDPAGTIACCKATIALMPEASQAHHLMGVALGTSRDYVDGLPGLSRALSLAIGSDLLSDAGNMLFLAGRGGAALRRLRQSLAFSPSVAGAIQNLCLAMDIGDDVDRASMWRRRLSHLDIMTAKALEEQRRGALWTIVGNTKDERDGWYRGDSIKTFPDEGRLPGRDVRAAIRHEILDGWLPPSPFLTRSHLITAFGSCFAANIERHLASRGYRTAISAAHNENAWTASLVIKCGEGLVNTFALRKQLEWALEGKRPNVRIWYRSERLITEYLDNHEAVTRSLIQSTDAFVITLVLSEVWFSRENGEFLWSPIPKSQFDAARYGFRVSTTAENLDNIT